MDGISLSIITILPFYLMLYKKKIHTLGILTMPGNKNLEKKW